MTLRTQAYLAAGDRGISFVMDGTFDQEVGGYTLITFGTMSLAQRNLAAHKLLDDTHKPVHSMRPFGLATTKSETGVAYTTCIVSSKVKVMRFLY